MCNELLLMWWYVLLTLLLLSPTGVCVFVSVFMGFRFYKTSKFFPAGFVALLR